MNEANETIINEVYEKAFQYEAEFGICPQAVLAALHDHFDFVDREVIKKGHFLAGGIVRSIDGHCGALSGGIMAIGCKYGRERNEFGEKTEIHEAGASLARQLHDRFAAEYGGVICREVQEKIFGRAFNLRDEKESEMFEEAGAHLDKCPSVTGNVARWTAELLINGNIKT
jgi:C_GCAxxG_C_C family probable redox protein